MALSRAPQTREIGTFSWEAGNLVVTKAPFCNEVLGWLVGWLFFNKAQQE